MKIKSIILPLLLFSASLCGSAQDNSADNSQQKPKKENAKKALKELQKQYEQLQKEHLLLEEAYKTLQAQDSTIQADVQAQEEARRQQESYYQQCRQNLYQEYTEYLDIPFSTISLQKISNIKDFAERYAEMDNNAPTLLARANACLKHKLDYDEMITLLSKPYNATDIKKNRDKLLVLRIMVNENRWDELAMSKSQWQETDSIDVFYARYQPGLKWLQGVMKKCEEQYRSDGLSASNRTDVVLSKDIRQDIINDADKRQIESVSRHISPQGNIADYILLIPWLRERYNIFISESNPLKPSEKTRKAMKEVLDINIGSH